MGGKFIGLIVIVVLGAVGWLALKNYSPKQDYNVSIAFGVAHQGNIEINALATTWMTQIEPPRVDPSNLKPLWTQWGKDHFDLTDATGAAVKLVLSTSTERSFIPPAKLTGAPVGYLYATLKQGATYTLSYIPKAAEAKLYQHTFTAPTADTPVARVLFTEP